MDKCSKHGRMACAVCSDEIGAGSYGNKENNSLITYILVIGILVIVAVFLAA